MGALRSPRRIAASAIDLYWGSGVCDDVPALAWFLLSSLVPLALGLTALASLVLGDYGEAQALAERAARVLPEGISDQLVQIILRTQRDSPLLLAGSIVLMVWTSAGAVGVLERSMSRQLGRRRFGPLLGKLRHLGLAAGLSVVIVLIVLAASHRGGLALWPAALAATGLLCASLYHLCPRQRIPWRAAWFGAAPAAIGLQAVPTLAGFYLQWVAGQSPVRVFLVLAGVLITSYLGSLSLLLGATVACRRAAPR